MCSSSNYGSLYSRRSERYSTWQRYSRTVLPMEACANGPAAHRWPHTETDRQTPSTLDTPTQRTYIHPCHVTYKRTMLYLQLQLQHPCIHRRRTPLSPPILRKPRKSYSWTTGKGGGSVQGSSEILTDPGMEWNAGSWLNGCQISWAPIIHRSADCLCWLSRAFSKEIHLIQCPHMAMVLCRYHNH